jgi:hypothetical protein
LTIALDALWLTGSSAISWGPYAPLHSPMVFDIPGGALPSDSVG